MPRPLALFRQVVAADAPISGSRLPLIVILHGGVGDTHYDTALALAEAGFIVAAVTHTGDNWRDHAYSFIPCNFLEQPRHISLGIDYLLSPWPGHDNIDASASSRSVTGQGDLPIYHARGDRRYSRNSFA